jgi:hypothetical protein
MVQVSPGVLAKLRASAEKAMQRVRAVRERGEHITEKAIRTVVVSGTAFSLGVVQGKTGGVEIMNIPLDLLVGAGAHVGGFMRIAGKHSDHLHNVGDGAMALFAGTMGRSVGNTWKTTGKLGFKSAGALPNVGTDFQSDAELANAVLRR